MTTIASTNAATGLVTRKTPAPPETMPPAVPPRRTPSRRRSKVLGNAKLYAVLLALMLPTLIGMVLFTYYPQWGAIKYSFYLWDGSYRGGVLEYVGLKNFIDIFTVDKVFWPSFQLTGILLLANLVKMWPSILAAVVVHRVRSERWQYIYRVMFVIPMIVPALVGLLVWKMFYDSTQGALNKFLNASGLMHVLQWLDHVMPKVAAALTPVRESLVDTVFANAWGLAVVGAVLLFSQRTTKAVTRSMVGWFFLGLAGTWAFSGWISAMTGATVAGMFFGFLVVTGMIVTAEYALAASRSRVAGDWPKWTGAVLVALSILFIVTTMIWTMPTRAFDNGAPAWLGHGKLVIPSIIFWGFPWVGSVGVLLYLAGLQNISQDVYEAGEIDGLNTFGKLWYLELPLILTQVRINLIFMTIGTLTDYYLIFLLLGPYGGPGGVGMTPGLYMYRSAFVDSQYGYACALGIVLFVLILLITIVYQKYVKVDK
jgi:ABC-type sugar transport system permease subunit